MVGCMTKKTVRKKRTIITEDLICKVKALFDNLVGSNQIATQLDISRHTVLKIYKKLGVYNIGRKAPRRAYQATEKCCRTCNVTSGISNFRKNTDRKGRVTYSSYCIECAPIVSRQTYKKNKGWWIRYGVKNADKIKKYVRDVTRPKLKERYKSDPQFKIRKLISAGIRNSLKRKGLKKNDTCIKYLPYTIDELKNHIESLFEPWMNWDNRGNYSPSTWNDNDQSTWTWQLDHIIPVSTFKYISMKDESFTACWALSNLRPLSAKQNILDGVNKIRHI